MQNIFKIYESPPPSGLTWPFSLAEVVADHGEGVGATAAPWWDGGGKHQCWYVSVDRQHYNLVYQQDQYI